MKNLSKYDVAEHLRTDEEMAAYLNACIEEADGDEALVATARADVARAKRMTETRSAHITPADGNIFMDLGFDPEEAARLLAETDKKIAEKLTRKKPR